MRRFILSVAVVLACAMGVGVASADDGHEDIEKAMKELHKGDNSVAARATKGEATAEEIAKLADAYRKMLAAKPEKGDEADWKNRVEALIAATGKLAAGEADAPAAYKQAVNCKACHKAHRED